MSPIQPQFQPSPDPILILGAGAFGLSTALSLLQRRQSNTNPYPPSAISRLLSTAPIHILDSSPTLPNPSGSSIDSSRIIRADYSNPVYSRLAHEAQKLWRDQSPEGWGGQGRYREDGFVVTADQLEDESGYEGNGEKEHGLRFVVAALNNVRAQARAQGANIVGKDCKKEDEEVKVEELPNIEAIRRVTGYTAARAGGGIGDTGYVNWGSGWANAEACVRYALDRIKREDRDGKVTVSTGMTLEKLLFEYPSHTSNSTSTISEREEGGVGQDKKPICTGIQLTTGQQIKSSLVILTTGAWTPSLIDLRGRAQASGQVMAYLDLSEQEQRQLQGRPVLMNMSRGLFVIPPASTAGGGAPGHLKVARHGFGYLNPRRVKVPRLSSRPPHTTSQSNGRQEEEKDDDMISIIASIPETSHSLPDNTLPIEASNGLRTFLRDIFPENPEIADRPWSKTRICWYGDTPTCNFLISHRPHISSGLFLATGGSGHGFKFFPVIGEKIVEAIKGKLDPELQGIWGWRDGEGENEGGERGGDGGFFEVQDESRGGKRGMKLWEELDRTAD